MAQAETLSSIYERGQQTLSDPRVGKIVDIYDELKGEECDHHSHDDNHHHHQNIVGEAISSAPSFDQGITEEVAQDLYFFHTLLRVQIKALEKSSVLGRHDDQTTDLLKDFKHQISVIEDLLSPKEMKFLSRQARNEQRKEDGEFRVVHGFRNWLDGTLTDEQSQVIKALEWQTAIGNFNPAKIVAGALEHFVEDHLSSPRAVLETAVITKVVVDSIDIMLSLTGSHQSEADSVMQADAMSGQVDHEFDPLAVSDIFADIAPVSEEELSRQLDQLCLEKINTDTNLIGRGIDSIADGAYCHEVSEWFRTMFEVSTATPRTLMNSQKTFAETVLEEGSLALELFERHFENAKSVIEKVAYYDNALHWVLLGVGALVGAGLVQKHGVLGAPKKMLDGLKKQASLVKDRPLTLSGAGAGVATFAGLNQGDVFDTNVVPYLVVGAMAGVIAQRKLIHLKDNKSLIFNINANADYKTDTAVPVTSLDKENNKVLKIMGGALAASAAAILANNSGLVNHQSPEILQNAMDAVTAAWAYGWGGSSWAVFDRLDDVAYHKTFFGVGVPTGIAGAAAVSLSLSSIMKIPGAQHVKKSIESGIETGRSKARELFMVASLHMSDVKKEFNLEEARQQRPVHYARHAESDHRDSLLFDGPEVVSI